jgi:hypothetical protein
VQKPVLYLGEINDSQHAAWCREIEAFDEDSRRSRRGCRTRAKAPAGATCYRRWFATG